MAQSPGFDMARLSTAAKVLGGATVLYLIVSFLAWNCVPAIEVFGVEAGGGCGFSLWSGVGILAGLLALGLLVIVAMRVLGVALPATVPWGTIVLGAALGVVLFTLLRILIKPVSGLSIGIFAWIGLVLSLAVAYGAYMWFQESKAAPGAPPAAAPPPPPPPGGGGFTS